MALDLAKRYLRNRGARAVYLALLCLFFAAFPLIAGPGPVNTRGGGDSPFLLVRLEQLVVGLRAGALPVRWMPDAAYGLGYPFFSFYAALPYWIAAGLRLLGWGPIAALQVTQLLGFVLAAVSMALLARRVLRHPAAVALAVVAYTLAPFHMVNVYVRGDSLSEFFAFAWYPLIVWALLEVAERPSLEPMSYLAFSYGGLVLTHNLSAILFSPFVAVLGLWLWIRGWKSRPDGEGEATGSGSRAGNGARKRARLSRLRVPNGRALVWMLAGGLLGLALSATLWLTAALELDTVWMGFKEIQTSGYFDYSGHFRALWPREGVLGLIQPSFLFRYEVAPGGTPFAMGAAQAALALIALAVCGAFCLRGVRRAGGGEAGAEPPDERTKRPSLLLFWILGFVVTTFMITPASRFLWDHLPVLPIAQFPWRFLSVQAFFGALLIGTLALRLPRPWWVALGGSALLVVSAVGALRPEYLPITESDVTPERLAIFESFTANVGTTIRGEYLPADVEPGLLASAVTHEHGRRPPPLVLEGEGVQAELLQRDARSERWQVTVAGDQARLAFHTLYYPGWRARVDGARAGLSALPGSGLISLSLPRGEHEVDLRFGRTPARWVADGISLAALVLVLGVLGVSRLAPPPFGAGHGKGWRALLWAAARALLAVCVLALVGRLLVRIKAVPPDNDLSMDFDRMPLVHHNPEGIDFGPARLLSYEYLPVGPAGPVESTSRELRIEDAQALTITSQWQVVPDPATEDAALAVEMLLVSPVDPLPRAPLPPPLARARAPLENGTGPVALTHVLAAPDDIAGGMYYVAVRLFDGTEERLAANQRGETLGRTYLYPVWIENPRPLADAPEAGVEGGEQLLARFGPSIVLQQDVRVVAEGDRWDVDLTWQTSAPIPANYTCSLRFLDANGAPLAQRDFAEGPGYGFWPTSTWPVGEKLTDRLSVAIPKGVRAEDAVAMSVVLYDRSQPGFPAAGTAIVSLGTRERRFTQPVVQHAVGAVLGDQIRLLGFDLAQDAQVLRLTLHWQAGEEWGAAGQVAPDYLVFVHLYDPDSETIFVQSDARPHRGTYPTSGWAANEVVSDEVVLDLSGVAPGSYQLAVGMVESTSKDRAAIQDAQGDMLPGGRLVLEQAVTVP